jgi:hypothetical protein
VPADAIRIEMLPARTGDCILAECLRRREILAAAGRRRTAHWPLYGNG